MPLISYYRSIYGLSVLQTCDCGVPTSCVVILWLLCVCHIYNTKVTSLGMKAQF